MFNQSKKLIKIKNVIEQKDAEKINLEIDSVKEIENILNYLLNRQEFYSRTYTCLEKSFKSAIKTIMQTEAAKINTISNDKKSGNKQEL